MVAVFPEKKKAVNTNIDTLARDYIDSLCKGVFPEPRPDLGEWDHLVSNLEMAYMKTERAHGDVPKVMQDTITTLCKHDNALANLLQPKPTIEVVDDAACPELPDAVKFDPKLITSGCRWLDNEYVPFSKKWSPRGYETYHEAIGIALLSTVAGRRVGYQFGPQKQYTNMYIALLGESTFLRKSTTARIYEGLLSAAKLDWLFGSDIVTPQKLVSNMAGKHITSDYGQLDIEEQETIKKRLAMSGQIGWFYDEFGMHMDQMVREGGVMADFKGLLRKLDDSKDKHGSDTIARSAEVIKKPYLSLLASMTPSDIKPHAQKDNKFWRDGLFARFCFVTPPADAEYSRARFPKGIPIYPATMVDPLKKWSDELGYPEIEIVSQMNKNGTEVTGYVVERIKELPEQECTAGPEIDNALYDYEGALMDMIKAKKIHPSLYPNYGRLHILALRVAMLFASFDNHGKIEMRHWARAQQFAEERRRDLHELFAQVNGSDGNDHDLMEQAIVTYVKQQEIACTASAIKQRCGSADVRKLSSKQITEMCESMARAGLLKKESPMQGQSAPRFSVQN